MTTLQITTDYDSQIDRLHNEGVPTDLLYQALSDLMALDLRGCWNNVEKAWRIARIKEALAARQAEVSKLASALADLITDKITAVISPAGPVLAAPAAAPMVPPAVRTSDGAARPASRIVWSRYPH